MSTRWVLGAILVLAGCAGMEPAGRNARGPVSAPPSINAAPTPAPVVSPAPPTPAPAVTAPAPITQPAPAVRAAPPVATPAPTPASTPRAASAQDDDDDIVVRGAVVQREIAPPSGDPRNAIDRNDDIHAWDECVSAVQAVFERDPMRPQLETPEEYCGRSLGMADRNAVPESRVRRR